MAAVLDLVGCDGVVCECSVSASLVVSYSSRLDNETNTHITRVNPC
jgi:hypothetical protein